MKKETAAHTPGPWTHRPNLFGAEGCEIRGAGDEMIGDLYDAGDGSRRVANARLIAAAPELLAAAQMIVETCPCDPDSTLSFETSWRLLLAAIQSATGAAK